MFGFFRKKEKKKKSPIPPYDAKLIKKFNKDHAKLVVHVVNVNNALESHKVEKAKQGLKQLKMAMLGHFMEEDIKLYWYLKDYYKESESMLGTIKTFEESIKKIQKDVVRFLDHYSNDTTALDSVFKKEFNDVIESLTTRMETEENNLYSLYVK